METENRLKGKILAIEKKIEELKKRMPAHSVSIEMMRELENLEDGLSAKKEKFNNGDKDKMPKSP